MLVVSGRPVRDCTPAEICGERAVTIFLRDAVLQCKNVLEVPVIVLCPKVITSSSTVHLPSLGIHPPRHPYPSILAAGPIDGIQLGWHPTRFGHGRFRAVRSKEPIVRLH